MDSSTLASIILAFIAVVPGIWALINAANKDKKEAIIKQTELAAAQLAQNQATTLSLLEPLRQENLRLQTKITELDNKISELEDELVTKNREHREEMRQLQQETFAKDATIQELQLNINGMKLRLDMFEGKSTDVETITRRKQEDKAQAEQRASEDSAALNKPAARKRKPATPTKGNG